MLDPSDFSPHSGLIFFYSAQVPNHLKEYTHSMNHTLRRLNREVRVSRWPENFDQHGRVKKDEKAPRGNPAITLHNGISLLFLL